MFNTKSDFTKKFEVSQFCTFFYIIIILKTKAQFLYMMKKKSMELFLYHYYEIFSFHRQRNLCVNIFFCKTWWLKHFAAHLNRKKIIWSLLEMTHKCALLSQKKTNCMPMPQIQKNCTILLKIKNYYFVGARFCLARAYFTTERNPQISSWRHLFLPQFITFLFA